jgi:hypothetical protein
MKISRNQYFYGAVFLFALVISSQLIPAARADQGAGVARINTEGMKKGCFYVSEVEDWKPLTSVNLIVYSPTRSKPYLLTIRPPSRELHHDQTIGFEAGFEGGRICGRVGDQLIIREGMARSFEVVDVRHLSEAAAQELLRQKEAGDLPLLEPADETQDAAAEGKSN